MSAEHWQRIATDLGRQRDALERRCVELQAQVVDERTILQAATRGADEAHRLELAGLRAELARLQARYRRVYAECERISADNSDLRATLASYEHYMRWPRYERREGLLSRLLRVVLAWP
jgi:hypothetical protein